MIRGDEQTIRAFATGPGHQILSFLQACLKDQDARLRVADGHDIYRAQGAAAELESIVALAKTARGN